MAPTRQFNNSSVHRSPNTPHIFPQKWLSGNPLRQFLVGIAVFVIYFGSARFGLSLAFLHANVSPVWPPTGVAIAAVLLLGYRVWPAIFLGAFLGNVFTPVSIVTAGGIAVGNTLEALAAGLLLQSFGFHDALDRAKDVFKFVVGSLCCTTISATVGSLSLCLSHAAAWQEFGSLWTTWWLGDTVGALVIAPLFLVWVGQAQNRWSPKRSLEGLLLLLLLAASAMATFAGSFPIPLKFYPLARLTVPFFLWAAFRLGQRGVTLATLTISILAIWGTTEGFGPFAGRTPNEALLLLQVFLGSNAVMFLFLAATVEERRLTAETLRKSEHQLAANLAVTQILAESPAINIATQRILETIGTMLDWEVGDMWTPNTDAKEIRCLTVWHAQTAQVDAFEKATNELAFTQGIGLPGRVWECRQPVWVPDLTRDDNFLRGPLAVSSGLHSAFAFPIISSERFLGVMEFFSREIRKPDAALLAMFSSVGIQIGQFIERKRAEEEREHLLSREFAARAEAELANRTKDEFLAIVSHELRTPLNAIVGWSGMLRAGKLEGERAVEAIEIIDRNAKTQAQLIDDILDVSRIVSGKLRLESRPVQLQQVVEAAIDSIRPIADSKNIHLKVMLEPDTNPISGDPERLQQVVWNLLSNAVKFTPTEGEVEIRLVNSNSHIAIAVKDTGAGIAAEFLPHVFDRFRQADSSKSRRHGGLGLGLAIVRHLVELHGGTVRAQSDGEGRGSEFTITLPCVGIEHEQSRLQTASDATGVSFDRIPGLVGLRILTVEDEADSREMLAMVLRAQGADVASVGSVREALQILNGKEWRPQILVSDLGMPEQDGYELIEQLRSRTSTEGGAMPAIALTGYAGKEESDRALDAGYQTLLAKPVNWYELVKTIAAFAEGERAGNGY
jgi:signal transduction histidine kinase/integral membrane sensor domain MASE1/ActR/RegA family two-component response regulator